MDYSYVDDYVIACTVALILAIYITRLLFFGIIRAQLSRKAYSRRRKQQSILQWFSYSCFKDVLPKFLRIWYFGHYAFYVFELLLLFVLIFFDMTIDIGRIVFGVSFFCYFVIPFGVLELLLFDKNKDSKPHIERLLKKRKK